VSPPGYPDRQGYLEQWSRLHGGVPPRGLVGGWLRVVHVCARPFVVLGVAPNAVTVAGLLVAVLALPSAAAGGRWPLLAVITVLVSALLDSVDGAVAVLTGRVSRLGAVLDPACDRLADLCFLGTLWLAGAAAGWCVAGGVLALLHEQLRASARANGMSEVGVVTVSERPTRVIVTAAFLLGAGLYPAAAPAWSTAGAIAWTGLGIIGVIQLAIAVKRRLN
jgi:phosphatidylglycerophosphate synthase